MTVASEITRIKGNIEAAYTAASAKGATLPATENSDNLATCIGTITGSSPVITSLSVTPTTSAQTITAPSGTDGYSPINVAAVTASIDANIVAGNIKKDVTILSVTGTYEGSGGGGTGIPREVVSGTYKAPATSFTFSLPSGATSIAPYALCGAFANCTGITSADLSSLTSITGTNALNLAFTNATNLTSIDLSGLTTVSTPYALEKVCSGCSNLTSVDLSNLSTVTGNYALNEAFVNCNNLTSINLSNLTTVNGNYAFRHTFEGCSLLANVNFSKLTTIANGSWSGAFDTCFWKCSALTTIDFPLLSDLTNADSAFTTCFNQCSALTDVYFRALTTTSFGTNTTQLKNIMMNTQTSKTHTIHFPSNLETTIQGLTGYPLFGGTSGYVTLAFDLTATS